MKRKSVFKTLIGSLVFCGLFQLTAFAARSGKVNTEDTNLRKRPTTTSEVITTIDKGTTVTIKDEEDGWYKVEVNGKTGFIRTDKVSVSSGESKSSSKSSGNSKMIGKTVVTKTDDLNLRKKPSTSSDVLKTIPINTKLKVRDVDGDWYQVSYDSAIGYVRSDKVSE